jgi:hypothetical protein
MSTPIDRISTAQLRERAEGLWRLARDFSHDDIGRLLREQAAELDAKADALEHKG